MTVVILEDAAADLEAGAQFYESCAPVRASKRVSFRAMMDYNPVFVNDSATGTRDFVRFSLGVLFH